MTVTIRSGLVALADGMRAYFEAHQVAATIPPVGWRYRTWQINQGPGGGSRVCLIPGKIDPTAPGPPKVLDAGQITQPWLSTPGPRLGGPSTGAGNPRPLRSWHKIVSLCVWGVDTTALDEDEKQLIAVENLFEWAIRAMHNAVDPVSGLNVGLADVELTETIWTKPPVDQAFGQEIVAYFIHHEPVFDVPIDVTTPKPGIERGPVTEGPLPAEPPPHVP